MNTIYIINDRKKGSVKFIKRDAETGGTILAAAIFSLHLFDETTQQYKEINSNLVTNSAGELIIDNLYPGKYKLVETEAPEGYYLEEGKEILFELTVDKSNEIIPLDPIVIENKPLIELRIIKVDSQNKEMLLSGANFTLVEILPVTKSIDKSAANAEEKILLTGLITDEKGELKPLKLKPGNYKLVEKSAPSGYELPENPETHFSI